MNRPIMIIVILGLGSGLAFGQVQRNVLDASPQMGVGGYNQPIPRFQSGYGAGGFGNLYITGNVTGGKQFRGFVPYSDPTQFRGSLGSNYLRTFEGDSINVQRVESGMTGGTVLPYYSRSSTILPLSAIRENYNLPGSSLPRTQVLPQSPSYVTGATLERSYTQSMQEQLPAAIRPSDVLVPNVAMPGMAPEDVYTRPMDMMDSRATEKALKPKKSLLEEERAREMIEPESVIEAPMIEDKNQPPQGRDLSEWLKEQAEQTERAGQSRMNLGPEQEYAESAKRLAVQGKEVRGAPGTTQPAKETPTRAVRPSGQSGQVVVTTLAGRGSDPFDQTMRAAQKLMNQGRFYDAYQVYAQAGSIKSDNPLAIYGQANALIAAGELRSAGERLRVAMKMFPKFVQLSIDGSRLLGSKAILERRLGQVRNLSIKNDDQDLMLLAGYMEILGGNRQAGLGLIGHVKVK